jgi:hypothetical protein
MKRTAATPRPPVSLAPKRLFVGPTSSQIDKHVKNLQRLGFTVVDVGGETFAQQHRYSVLTESDNFPEFKEGSKGRVLGGFSALGNPSSFHNPAVRELRRIIHPIVRNIMQDYAPEGSNFEQIIDRMMIRPAGVSPSRESWHRDEAPSAHDDDMVFGGWVNLDAKNQFFSCVPETHLATRGNEGFHVLSKEVHAELNKNRFKVCIPPGHLLIFHEHIIHEVNATKLKYDSVRLFLGWRVTKSISPLHDDILKRLEDQDVMKLKSNQEPPMYARLHWTNWRGRLDEFSRTNLNDYCQTERVLTRKDGTNETYIVPLTEPKTRKMYSLTELGLPLYEPYTHDEIMMHLPQKL